MTVTASTADGGDANRPYGRDGVFRYFLGSRRLPYAVIGQAVCWKTVPGLSRPHADGPVRPESGGGSRGGAAARAPQRD